MPGELALVNLEGAGTFVFQFFPRELQIQRRAFWETQDVTRGTQPLFFGNREPKRISINELWLDKTDAGESIQPDVDALLALQDDDPKLGRPSALLLLYGEQQERCVLEEVTITDTWFSPEGDPQRARVSLQLVELQELGTAVGVTITG